MKTMIARIFGFLAKLLLLRLPAALVLGVLAGASMYAIEMQYADSFPLWPVTLEAPPEIRNPSAPENPSQLPLLATPDDRLTAMGLPVDALPLDTGFGEPGYGTLLGAMFAIAVALPLGLLLLLRRYGLSLATLLLRLPVAGLCYLALFGGVGYLLSSSFGAQLLTTGYAVAFGAALPFLLPLPMALVIGVFPGSASRQASRIVHRSAKQARGPLVDLAKRDAVLHSAIRKDRKNWNYFGTVAGSYIAMLMGERHEVPETRRKRVQKRVERRLNRIKKTGSEDLQKLAKYVNKQLSEGTKLTTDYLVGLWLIVKSVGQSDQVDNKRLAKELGSQLVASQGTTWDRGGAGGAALLAVMMWLITAALGGAFVYRGAVADRLEQYGIAPEVAEALREGTGEETELAAAGNAANEAAPQPPKSDAADGDAANDTADATGEPPDALPGLSDMPKSESPALEDGAGEKSQPPEKGPLLVEPQPDEKADASAEDRPQPNSAETNTADPPAGNTPAGNTPAAQEPPAEKESAGKKEPGSTPSADPLSSAERDKSSDDPAKAEEDSFLRRWTDLQGRTIVAEYLGYRNGKIGLKREDGVTGYLPLENFSRADRQLVLEQSSTTEDAPAASDKPLIVRTWTDATGERTFKAALLDVADGKARFLRADGRLGSLPLEMLSDADRARLEQ